MSPFLRDALTAYLATVEIADDDLLFTTREGKPRTRQNIANNILRPILTEADALRNGQGQASLPAGITPHTLRRTYVTLCVQAGWSIGFVVKQVGHTDANTTHRFYLQASTGEQDPALRELARQLVGSPGAAR